MATDGLIQTIPTSLLIRSRQEKYGSGTERKETICITGVPEEDERKKGAENLHKENIAKNTSNVGRDLDNPFMKLASFPQNLTKRDISKTYCNKTVRNQSKREKLKVAREKKHKAINRFLSRTLTGQERAR